ncbi:hypothetical protein SISSUDRAFT_1038240 [Sistotremastrum suecicum HHB10207 ss-3]|uniref:Uncharacterized protein n=1 Tax=Sistotremastrum suecicum HHB10207 ss-3 TaxID=1314776 RepID=A0A165X155_9AGAM|nr:hypothetical protein SISSUDRAFT_1038240 [Sistotremastrum suecicum HHB10207 ss-3]
MDEHHVPSPAQALQYRKLNQKEADPIRSVRLQRCLEVIKGGFDPLTDPLFPRYILAAWEKRGLPRDLKHLKFDAIRPFVSGDVFTKDGQLMILDADPASAAKYCEFLILRRYMSDHTFRDVAKAKSANVSSAQDTHLVLLKALGPKALAALLSTMGKYFPTCSYVLEVSPAQPVAMILVSLYSCHSSLLAEALSNVLSRNQKNLGTGNHSRSSSGSHNSVQDGWSTSSYPTHSRQASSSTVATELSIHQGAKQDKDPRSVLPQSEFGEKTEQLTEQLAQVKLDTNFKGASGSKPKPAKRG